MIVGQFGRRNLVCWDDGKGKGDGAQLIYDNHPEIANTAAIAHDFDGYHSCVNNQNVECKGVGIPHAEPPTETTANPGPADFGTTPGEMSPSPDWYSPVGETLIEQKCGCLKKFPLAVLDARYTTIDGAPKPSCFIPLFSGFPF